jgi:D-sedoheptulose 7-phosphate isomerase
MSEDAARAYLESSARSLRELADGDAPALAAKAGSILAETLAAGGTVLLCGNGGSAADAQHMAAELVGKLDAGADRDPLRAVALTTDTSVLTALANDYGFGEVFARQVRALGRRGDALVCFSTSGGSANVERAAEAGREAGMRIVALLGPTASPLDDLADIALHVPGGSSGEIQQGHIAIGHLMCRLAEGTGP